MGGLEGPPKPPTLRASAEPWRFAIVARCRKKRQAEAALH
jgi:hypothetical protein